MHIDYLEIYMNSYSKIMVHKWKGRPVKSTLVAAGWIGSVDDDHHN